jgi:hypothetical protein
MATRKKIGLGKSLSQIMAEGSRIDRARADSQIIPSQLPENIDDYGTLNEDFVLIPREEGDEEFEEANIDFDTQFVIDAKPPKDNYGLGPDRSTRVAAHKFVPSLLSRAGVKSGTTLGTVYVKFQPNMQGKRANDIYRYKNVPENVYEQFAQSNSKGRFINNFLNSYPYSRITTREDRYHAQDFRQSSESQ